MSDDGDDNLDQRLNTGDLRRGDLRRLLERNPRLQGYAEIRQRPPEKPRLTVVEVCYWQEPDGQPVNFDGSYTALAETADQPCPPRLRIDGDWQPLQRLWLTECLLLCLRYDEGRFQVRPTPAQLAEATARVVDVGVVAGDDVVPFAELHPGRSLRLQPCSLDRYRLRCRRGSAAVAVMAFPR